MLEELAGIDTTAVQELRQHKGERDVVAGRLEAMEARRDKVSAEVFARVRADYEQRLAALDEKARPLQDAVRAEYVKLRSLLERLSTQLREAVLAKEEIEFRYALGEFDDAVFRDHLGKAEDSVAACEAKLTEAQELRAQFVEAFGSEAGLDGGEVVEPFEPVPAPPPPGRGDEYADATLLTESPAAGAMALPGLSGGVPLGGFPGDSAVATGVTRPMPADVIAGTGAAGAAPAAEAGGSSPAESPGNASLAVARLVARLPDGRDEEFALQLGTTTIGRSPKNDVCLRDASVSRQHAKIVFTERGFVIYDLGSENGVYVNGDRVTHRLLSEGDEIEFGPGLQPFVFRAP